MKAVHQSLSLLGDVFASLMLSQLCLPLMRSIYKMDHLTMFGATGYSIWQKVWGEKQNQTIQKIKQLSW